MRQNGLTLVEVAVATALLGLVMGLAGTALVASQRVTSEALTRERATRNVAAALAVMIPEIRSSGEPQVSVAASPEGGASQLIRFRTNTGLDRFSQRVVWSAETVAYWYDAAGRRLKRQ